MKKQTSILLLLLTFLLVNIDSVTAQQKHEYVDLGLPSGTLWAACNVGAENPEDAGDYFAWGETEPKDTYSWSNYKYGKYSVMLKYNDTDSLTSLEKSDDVAYQKWGSDWCMPTQTQFQELKDKCTWTWTSRNSKNGYEVKGSNGNSIFLPAAGYMPDGSNISSDGINGLYWSSSRVEDNPIFSYYLFCFRFNVYPDNKYYRCYGQSVRPVRCRK